MKIDFTILFNYCHKTGVITNKTTRSNRAIIGREAGSLDRQSGYRQIILNGKKYYAHRLAWFLYYGSVPHGEIDHINHNRSDNRISNLRDVECIDNAQNRPLQKNNISGYHGVRFRADKDKWEARIKVKQKIHILGLFQTKEEAIVSRKKAEKEYGFHKNHGKIFEQRRGA